MRNTRKALALLALASLAATACGSKSSGGTPAGTVSNTTSSVPTTTASTASFKACMVTDTGGIDDRSFNASAWAGIQNSEKDLGVQGTYLQSKTENDYTPNISALLGQNCGIIVTVGFLMGDATAAAAKANPNQKFAIVDNQTAGSNVQSLLFDTSQAGFLGGYLAAGMSKTAHHRHVRRPEDRAGHRLHGRVRRGRRVLRQQARHQRPRCSGWDKKKQNGTFTGDFTDQAKGKNVTRDVHAAGRRRHLPGRRQRRPRYDGRGQGRRRRQGAHAVGRHRRLRQRRQGLPAVHLQRPQGHRGRGRGVGEGRADRDASRAATTSAPSPTTASDSRRTTTSRRRCPRRCRPRSRRSSRGSSRARSR